MERRQAANDLKKLTNMSPLDQTRVGILCYTSWQVLENAFSLHGTNSVNALAKMTDSSWKVSAARIQAARENAPYGDLMALSIWQSTARAATRNHDPQLIATTVSIWNLLRKAEADDENLLAEAARSFSQECFDALCELQP
jgi:hypothetical protein